MAKILLVEDSNYQRRSIKRFLEGLNHEVSEAADGSIALKALETEQPDLICTDIAMPEMSGDELVRVLYEKQNKIPIIILSSDVQEKTKESMMQYGIVAFVNKPLDPPQLEKALSEALG